MEYITKNLGYKVIEVSGGLDVYDTDNQFQCELSGYVLSDFDCNGVTDNDKLEAEIIYEIDALNAQGQNV